MASVDLSLVIGTKTLSSWSLRPWLALRMAGIAFEEILIELDRPETGVQIRAHSPAGLVPILKHGRVTVWDSLAIIEYANDVLMPGALWPEDPAARARARSISAEMHAGFSALRETMPMAFADDLTPHTPRPEAQRDIDRILTLWTEARADHGAGGPFLFGAFSGADAMYAPVVSRFRTYGVSLPPVARAYADAVWALPAMQDWLAGSKAGSG